MRTFLFKLSIIALTLFWFIGYFSKQTSWQLASGYSSMHEQEKPSFYTPPDSKYPEIHWLGHAGNLIKWQGLNILLDPILSDYSVILPRLSKSPIAAEELPPIDFVILSHMHYDHYDKDTLENIKVIRKLIIPNKSEKFISESIKIKTEINQYIIKIFANDHC